MATVKLILDSRSKKKDGTSPIKLRIIHEGQTYHISTEYSVLPKDWNGQTQQVKPSCKSLGSVTRINSLLIKKQDKAMKVLTRLEDEERLAQMSFAEIKALILNKKTQSYVIEFCDEVIAEMKRAGKVGNAGVYKTLVNSLYLFLNGRIRKDDTRTQWKDIPFQQITFKWLKKYEAWYLGRGNSANGLSVNLRTLRALYNRAIKQQLVGREFYPFELYKIKSEKTKKRAIGKDDIDKIKAYTPRTLRQERAKDFFLMSFYLMGASFIDLVFLKLSNIVGDRIEFKRKKTGHQHSIKITLPLQAILDKYLDRKSGNDYILNVISTPDVHQQYKQVSNEIRRYNRALKEIGEACGIAQKDLTSYVARHSFASIANNKKVPLTVISQALGHENPETTKIYLSSFDNNTMDEYNELIIGD